MAKVTLSILVTDVRRKLGNVVFSKWRETNYVREYVKYFTGNSEKQIGIRSAFSTLVSVWKTMGDLIQASWVDYTSNLNMTGYNAFIAANSGRILGSAGIELSKPMGEEPVASLSAATGTAAGEITCTFAMPAGSTGKNLFFFSQKRDAGKGTGEVKRHDAGVNALSPYTLTGLEADADYFVYAVLADGEYTSAKKVSASVYASAKAGV